MNIKSYQVELNTAGQLATIGIQALGVGLAMSGVTGYLTPDSPSEAGDSYLFDGPANNVKQGVPVPICYGQLIVGGAVMNFGFVEDRIDNFITSGYERVTKMKIVLQEAGKEKQAEHQETIQATQVTIIKMYHNQERSSKWRLKRAGSGLVEVAVYQNEEFRQIL